MRVTTTLVALLFACNKDQEPDSWPSLVQTTALEAGNEDCPEGGTRIDAGNDDGTPSGTAGDGELQDGEIDETVFECEELPAHAVVAAISELGLNEGTCPFGGQRLSYGHDDGDPSGTADDGILQDGEIEDHADVCLDAADGLLVVTTTLPSGDADCPNGGTFYEYGVDDGLPGGTANDGILDASERDGSHRICLVEVADVFGALVPTDPGTEGFDLRGGSGADAGSGGDLYVYAYGGALATAIVLRKDGDLGIEVPASSVTIDFGAAPHEVTGTQAITVWDGNGGEPAGLHVREAEDVPHTLYAGSTAITGLHVAAGATLQLPAASVTSLVFPADVHNEGTIVAAEYAPDAAGSLILRCDDFVNAEAALVDLRGDLSSGKLVILAIASSTSRLLNEGGLRTNSRDRPSPGSAGDMLLLARGDLHNEGAVFVRGGTSGNASNPGAGAGGLALVSTGGVVYNGGNLNAQGGDGTDGGSGGRVWIGAGLPREALDSYDLSVDELDEGLLDPGPGGGGFVQDGTIQVFGGAGAGQGGPGGEILLDIRGGDVLAAGIFDLSGGDGTATVGGQAGSLEVLVAPVIVGGQVLRAEQVAFQATVVGPGGDGPTSGGRGGSVEVQVDVTMTSEEAFGMVPEGIGVVDLPGQYGQTPLIVTLAGLGEGIDVSAGSGVDGFGGFASAAVMPCYGEQPACAIPRVGARWVHNDVDIDASASESGGGGSFSFEVLGEPNTVLPIRDVSLVENTGLLIGAGGSGSGAQCGSAGEILLGADGGEVRNAAALSFPGGDCTAGYGGGGGQVRMWGLIVDHTGDLDASGGLGTPNAGSGGLLEVDAGRVALDGDLDVSGASVDDPIEVLPGQGGDVTVSGVDVAIDADIDATAGAVSNGDDVDTLRRGGDIVIRAATATLAGVWDASAGDQHANDCKPAYGGSITVDAAVSIAADVDLFADAGACLLPSNAVDNAAAGLGGTVRLAAPVISGAQTISVRGGDATTSTSQPANGGQGGIVQIGRDSGAVIDCSGGAANGSIGSDGGNGGEVTIVGDNAGDVACLGGDANSGAEGGNGGRIRIGGDNTGCLDVTMGLPGGGNPGSIVVGGTDNGACAARRTR